jgi:hypothetical protein
MDNSKKTVVPRAKGTRKPARGGRRHYSRRKPTTEAADHAKADQAMEKNAKTFKRVAKQVIKRGGTAHVVNKGYADAKLKIGTEYIGLNAIKLDFPWNGTQVNTVSVMSDVLGAAQLHLMEYCKLMPSMIQVNPQTGKTYGTTGANPIDWLNYFMVCFYKMAKKYSNIAFINGGNAIVFDCADDLPIPLAWGLWCARYLSAMRGGVTVKRSGNYQLLPSTGYGGISNVSGNSLDSNWTGAPNFQLYGTQDDPVLLGVVYGRVLFPQSLIGAISYNFTDVLSGGNPYYNSPNYNLCLSKITSYVSCLAFDKFPHINTQDDFSSFCYPIAAGGTISTAYTNNSPVTCVSPHFIAGEALARTPTQTNPWPSIPAIQIKGIPTMTQIIYTPSYLTPLPNGPFNGTQVLAYINVRQEKLGEYMSERQRFPRAYAVAGIKINDVISQVIYKPISWLSFLNACLQELSVVISKIAVPSAATSLFQNVSTAVFNNTTGVIGLLTTFINFVQTSFCAQITRYGNPGVIGWSTVPAQPPQLAWADYPTKDLPFVMALWMRCCRITGDWDGTRNRIAIPFHHLGFINQVGAQTFPAPNVFNTWFGLAGSATGTASAGNPNGAIGNLNLDSFPYLPFNIITSTTQQFGANWYGIISSQNPSIVNNGPALFNCVQVTNAGIVATGGLNFNSYNICYINPVSMYPQIARFVNMLYTWNQIKKSNRFTVNDGSHLGSSNLNTIVGCFISGQNPNSLSFGVSEVDAGLNATFSGGLICIQPYTPTIITSAYWLDSAGIGLSIGLPLCLTFIGPASDNGVAQNPPNAFYTNLPVTSNDYTRDFVQEIYDNGAIEKSQKNLETLHQDGKHMEVDCMLTRLRSIAGKAKKVVGGLVPTLKNMAISVISSQKIPKYVGITCKLVGSATGLPGTNLGCECLEQIIDHLQKTSKFTRDAYTPKAKQLEGLLKQEVNRA